MHVEVVTEMGVLKTDTKIVAVEAMSVKVYIKQTGGAPEVTIFDLQDSKVGQSWKERS